MIRHRDEWRHHAVIVARGARINCPPGHGGADAIVKAAPARRRCRSTLRFKFAIGTPPRRSPGSADAVVVERTEEGQLGPAPDGFR
jgi:hypothetical protein